MKRKRGRPRSTPEDEEIEVVLIPIIESDEDFEKRRDGVQEILKRIILLGMRKEVDSDVLKEADPEV